jgi:hypothetical protein
MQTIFSSPEPLRDWRYRAEPKRGVELGRVASLLTLPFLLIAAGLYFPYVLGWGLVQARKRRKFLEKMKALGRVMDWSDFVQAMDETRGTAIVERYSLAGTVTTLWWTPENIYEVCPYSPVDWEALRDESFLPFAEWCRERYSSPEVGRALLVGPSPKGEASSLRFRFEVCGDPGPSARWIEVVPPEVLRKKKRQLAKHRKYTH